MSALDHIAQPAAALTRVVSVVARVGEFANGLGRALRNRRKIGNLAELSDHHLADIGLTRADLSVVMRGPVSSDPTTGLAHLARERARLEMRPARLG
jgi:uncharacterized protein YjiS (DUF1127 family)